MEEKNLNKNLDELIEAAIPTIKANMIDDSDEAPEHIESSDHEKKMQEIFELARRMEKNPEGTKDEYIAMIKSYEEKSNNNNQNSPDNVNNETHKNIVHINRNKKFFVALAAAVLMLGLIGVVGASKLDIVKALLDNREEYSKIKDNNFTANEAEFEDVRFAYIPKGYKFVETIDLESRDGYLFENEETGVYFMFEAKKRKWSGRVDTEKSMSEEIMINDKVAVYTLKDDLGMISWKGNDMSEYVIYGDCGKNVLQKVAENIEILKIVSQSGE